MHIGKLPPDILNRLLARTYADPSVLVGPAYGEDAAAVKFGNRVLVAASDPVTLTTERIGYYAVSVNANDIAVMGATPRYFLATILLPVSSTESEAESVFHEIQHACEEIGVVLIGGHTEITDAIERVVVSGCMLGETTERALVRTSGARPGDMLIVAGAIAVEGTSILAREATSELLARGISRQQVDAAMSYIDDPGICIIDYARAAVEAGGVTAMHDPTEGGLATALREMATASSCGMRIARESIPVLDECAAFCSALGLDPLGLIASGCLLIAASPDAAAGILAYLAEECIPARAIGEVVDASEGLKFEDGSDLPSFDRDEIARYLEVNRG